MYKQIASSFILTVLFHCEKSVNKDMQLRLLHIKLCLTLTTYHINYDYNFHGIMKMLVLDRIVKDVNRVS